MINLYVKFTVHSSYVKQVIILKNGGQTDGRTDAPGDDNRHPPKFWLRPKNCLINPFEYQLQIGTFFLSKHYFHSPFVIW